MRWRGFDNKGFFSWLMVLPLVIFASGIAPTLPAQKGANARTWFHRFDFLSDSSGWVLLSQDLFWTSDAGQSWEAVGPSIPPDATIQDVDFIDADVGWMLWTTTNADGSAIFTLAKTTDHGTSWNTVPLGLFEAGEVPAHAKGATMGWLDAQTGWIAVKQSGSSNFSLGTLFTTSDGGATWTRSTLPVADRVTFNEPQTGWAVGGPAGDQIFKSQDGGLTWQKSEPALPPDSSITAYEPFYTNGQGILVLTSVGPENSLRVYGLENSSGSWLPVDHVSLDIEPGMIGLSILDTKDFVATIPGTDLVIRMQNGELDTLKNADGLSASIVDLDMTSMDVGWARSVEADCATAASSNDESASVSCASPIRLLRTQDGGITWQAVRLPTISTDAFAPGVSATNRSFIMNALPNLGNTEIFIGQGFDKCEIPTLSQLQTWWNSSPYKTVNLYFGGSSRACTNTALTSSYLEQLYQQGWKFIPTWVGPQAPCTGYISRMSSDPIIAYNQGVNEANLAVEQLYNLGLTYPDKTGSVVYYDIEYYGTSTACRDAVNAFMNGWVSQLHARGNLAGVYGSTLCNTGLSDFLTITSTPDVIWAARWYHNLGQGYYDPTATVWDLGTCVPNTAWADHQRIRQYEGDHDETWGDLTLGIDSNVLDGVVAIPYLSPFVRSIVRADPNPTYTSNVNFTITFSKPVTGLDADDFILTTTGISEAAISNITGTGTTYAITVGTGSGNGTIRLDVMDNDSIKDLTNNPLGGLGLKNGDFTTGETYTIIKDPTFGDVPVNYWAWRYIERLSTAGITSGCSLSPLQYCPEITVTRAQMAVFLLKAKYGPSYTPPPVGTSTGFDDVPTDYWSAAWIKQLAAEGITSGCGDGNYCPDDSVTRAQMAVFLLKAKYGSSYGPPAVGTNTGFGDVPTTHWAASWIEQLVAEGITSGCGNGNYCPDDPVTRSQMAVFLVKTFDLP